LDPARAVSLLNVIRVVVMGLTVILGLSIIGINLSSLAVLFGVLGIGVGFGLQDAVADMFAGVVIMFARPIKEGDRVLVEEHEGTVHQIKLLHSVINTITHETIIIPNSKITGNSMHNYSYDDARIILCNTVQVSYGSDLDQVGQVLLEMAHRNPWAIEGMEPRYQVWSFDDSGITVRICTWIRDARDRIPAFSWTNLEIWRAFRANGIEIPFPQMDLHVKDMAPGRLEPPTTESGGDLGPRQ
jgi:small-conductance mechanosensitive channel